MEDDMLRHLVIAGRGQGEAGRGQIPHEDKSAAQGAAGRDHGSEGVLETQTFCLLLIYFLSSNKKTK